jgi:uncharacterized protein YndB with AHSA1/START domain
MTHLNEWQTGLTTVIESEVSIAAEPQAVWHALTAEVGHWWAHSFSETPYAITLEARVGGQFAEAFDAAGNGALYATVTYCEPPRRLKYVGSMGMDRAVLNQSTYELSAQNGGTLVSKRMEVLGVVPPEVAASYRKGSQVLMECLKAFVETGTRVR